MAEITTMKQPRSNGLALIPFLVFMVFYLGLSCWTNDFYKVPMPIAFLLASAVALIFNRRKALSEKVDIYARGMGDTNIMIMCLIFILAGAFATVAKQMGAVSAAVEIAQVLVPARLMLAGIFLVSCLISLSIGTSCGTIAALTPIAAGLVEAMGISPALMIGAVVGGSMFGDNLSMISDTTIAATRTQGIEMREKFLSNIRIALPAAVLSLVIYGVLGKAASLETVPTLTLQHGVLVLPYLLILGLALAGMNVMALLFLGTVLAAVIGICTGKLLFWDGLAAMGSGSLGMAETLFVALLAGGLLSTIRENGGIAWLIEKIERVSHGTRGCEFGVLLLVAAVNLFTANNTVAIVIAGPIAKDLSDRFGCVPRRIASILDATSCVVQGMIPYGAQILIAVGLAKTAGYEISPISLISTLYYPFLLAAAILMTIFVGGKVSRR